MSVYSFVRIVFVAVLLAVGIFLIKKILHITKQRAAIISVIIFCGVLLSLLELFPVENKFMSFDTPEEAYAYYSNNKIDVMIKGTDSCLILSDAQSKSMQIFTKDGDDWQIRTGLDVDISPGNSVDTVFIYVLSSNDSDDTYLKIKNVSQKEMALEDNRGSVFYEESPGTYYAYADDIYDEYTLSINGEIINVFN